MYAIEKFRIIDRVIYPFSFPVKYLKHNTRSCIFFSVESLPCVDARFQSVVVIITAMDLEKVNLPG